MTRIGKIGRLDKKVRDELGHRIENGAPGADIVNWLNEQPNTQKVVARFFDGKGVTEQNLSDWKQSGHAEWVRRQAAQEALIQFVEHGSEMQALTRGRDVAGQLVSVMLAEMVQVVSGLLESETDLEKRWQRLQEVHRELSRLRRDEDRAAHTHMERVEWVWRDVKERGHRGEEEERFNRNLQRWQSEAFEEARKDLVAKANGVEEQEEEMKPAKGRRQKGKGARSKGEVCHRGAESTETGGVVHACAGEKVMGDAGGEGGRESGLIVANRVKEGTEGTEGSADGAGWDVLDAGGTGETDVATIDANAAGEKCPENPQESGLIVPNRVKEGEGCHRGIESTEGGKVAQPACADEPVNGLESRLIVPNRVKNEGTDGTLETDGIVDDSVRDVRLDAGRTGGTPVATIAGGTSVATIEADTAGEKGPKNSGESRLIVANRVIPPHAAEHTPPARQFEAEKTPQKGLPGHCQNLLTTFGLPGGGFR